MDEQTQLIYMQVRLTRLLVSIPVIGSGDVMEPADCVRMLGSTGAAGVFVARGSYGNPWIFERAYALLRTGVLPPAPGARERLDALELHVRRSCEAGAHMVRLRPVTCWYIKGLPGASMWRDRAMACREATDYLTLIEDMRRACDEHGLV